MKLYLYPILLFLVACSFSNFQENPESVEGQRIQISECKIPEKQTNIISTNQLLNEQFEEYSVVNQLNFSKQALLFSILQPISYPNASTLNAKIFTMIKSKGKLKSFSITALDFANTYKEYLDLLSKELLISDREKQNFFNKFDRTYPRQVPISKEFQNYLEVNKKFYNASSMREITFRGNQLLKYGESIRRPNISDIRLSQTKKRPIILDTTFKGPKGLTCNFDYRLFGETPLLQRKSQTIYSNLFAVIKDKDNYVITLTSSSPILKENKDLSFLLQSRPIDSFNTAICFSKNNEYLISKSSPHAEQILLNTISTMTEGVITPQVRTLLLKQRSLHLLYPDRTVYEIFGTSSEEVNRVTEEDVFFVPRLGSIDILQIDNFATLYEDPRGFGPICN
ncbi:hypothetical protein [Bacteriovorax sp. Seq25_V]|uniref:hypothetical protein n=1 Tax=Bacteriovorax sp. Seq25_V TaxID=1201288 RepID=UPI00038A2FF7|nr:hypothetical protein [Bacteriovorax sp. Seq25_V]EQC44223.1 putative lipoprotein [Bacteriovorax sp. Seq25_V]